MDFNGISNDPYSRPLVSIPLTAFTVATLTMSISSWVAYDMSRSLTVNNEVSPTDRRCQHSSYDYIIVGAGAAGMVVATRLANSSQNIRVLLLEAGGEPHFVLNNLPCLDFNLMNKPANNYIYYSTKQTDSCQNCDGKRAVTARGKMLGGSTSTNFMLYARGHGEDYNRWAVDAEDDQWSYKNVLPYFMKSENYNGAYAKEKSVYKYHGRGGLLNIATHDYMPGVHDFLAAAYEKGYKIGDYNNGENDEVFSKIDVTTKHGWRESTYRAFYLNTGKPKNLCIKTYAHVTKINFGISSDGKPKAVGVTYHRQYQKRSVTATREVILSAGAIESPKLLMLSGVGPKVHLTDLNIPVIADLPVGRNMQDHVYSLVPFIKAPSLNSATAFSPRSLTSFLFSGKGPLAAPAGFAGQGFFQSPNADPPYPNLQTIQFSIGLYPEISSLLNKVLGLDIESLDEWFYPYNKKFTNARLPVILLGRPKSVGELRLESRNPKDPPILEPNYLSAPEDVEALLYGYKTIVDLYENTKALNTTLLPKPVPGCENLKFKSDDYYRCAIKHVSGSFYHHVGTCALGKVVDSKLRVKGIDGLRVIDASIIPRAPNANTQAATIMLSELGADLIKKDMKEFKISYGNGGYDYQSLNEVK